MAENFIDLYRETNPGERRMQSAKGLQDTGFQGIIKSYQMGKGGAEASAYDEKRAEAAGKYAKRQEALDSIKALKDAVPMVENYFWSQIKQGKSKEEAAKSTGEFANFAIPKGILPEGWEIKLVESIPEEGRDVVRADSYNPKTGMNEVKFLSVGNKTYNVEQFDGTTGKWIPFTGMSSKKTAAEQGKSVKKIKYLSVEQGKPAIEVEEGKPIPAYYYAQGAKEDEVSALRRSLRRDKKKESGEPAQKPGFLNRVFGGDSDKTPDNRIPSPF